jgi:hypothetical protein
MVYEGCRGDTRKQDKTLARKDLVRFIYCQSNEKDTSDILTEHDVFSQLLLLLRLFIVKMYDIPPEYTSCSSPDAFNQIENEYLNFFAKYKRFCWSMT